MATNISPELLGLLRQQDAATYNITPYFDPATGRYYQPEYAGNGSENAEGGGGIGPGPLLGYVSYDQNFGPGMKGIRYNPDGTFSNEFNYQDDQALQNFLIPLAAATGMYFGLPALMGAQGAGAAAGSEALTGVDAAMADLAASSPAFSGTADALGGSGAFLGEGMASGVPAWDAAATNAGLSLTAPAAGGGLLNQVGNVVKDAATKAPSWLGPAATVLGAAAGSQGQQTNATATKDIPEWLQPSVMGLLAQTDALRNKQMQPGYLQGFSDMRSVGQGLLNQPIRPNGFNLFTGR